MPFKFEKLEVWQLSPDYIDLLYEIGDRLPRSKVYNLKSQMTRAATSIVIRPLSFVNHQKGDNYGRHGIRTARRLEVVG
jgi:hypothetical protein